MELVMNPTIIDMHTHLAYDALYPAPFLMGLVGDSQAVANKDIVEMVLSAMLKDVSGKQHLKQMHNAGIEKSVLLIIDGGIGMEEAKLSIEQIYEVHAELAKTYQNEMLVFGGIDPRRGKQGVALFKKGIEEYGFKGLKLYPPMGFSLDDDALIPYFELCESYGYPVLLHAGPSLACLHNHHSAPRCVQHVANRYQGIDFILAHAGYMLHDSDVTDMLKLKNVYADISGFQKMVPMLKAKGQKTFELIFSEQYCDKILFGSDWPLFSVMNPIQNDIALFMQLSQNSGLHNQQTVDKILSLNARKILGLDL
jgi:predicted TIM-barrel fold metal-dependent hydrolase